MIAMPKCQSCGSGMQWGVTIDGARMPLDLEPTPGGNVWIRHDGRLRVLSADETHRAIATGQELYMPHHATCPGRGRHAVPRSQMTLDVDQ